MGKDKAKDGDAATSTDASRDHSRDQESRNAALAGTIAEAVAGAFAKQKADDTRLIMETFTRQMSSIYHRDIEHFFHISCWKYCF